MISENLTPDLVKVGLEVSSQEELLQTMGHILIQGGYCHPTFIEALIKREAESPTGLDLNGFGLAIPHTVPEHVIKSGLAFASLKNPIRFTLMGTDDEFIEVKLICVLAIDNANAHMDRLEALLGLLRDKQTLAALAEAESPLIFIEEIRKKETQI
ncbi:MAG: PTS sugar transporter subunit IIA [Deltaproteobacteria bacterium]|jgi:PTS system galactitol-specific IIA component|nr:PTS sugar transporter subunit IIA [Deltaproteobacteria bacterium]